MPCPVLHPHPREGMCSHQTNTETLERAKEPSNQSRTVEKRMGVVAGTREGKDEDMAWVSEVTDHHRSNSQLFLDDDPRTLLLLPKGH